MDKFVDVDVVVEEVVEAEVASVAQVKLLFLIPPFIIQLVTELNGNCLLQMNLVAGFRVKMY